jgi:SAM-dependent methyltransferase
MGAGSAILAIAAARADHRCRALAVDNDPLAVAVAADNARRNHVAGRVRALLSEGYADPAIRRAGPFDLVFANILADPLIAMAEDLRRHLAPGGVAVLSGLLDRQAPRVLAAHRARGCGRSPGSTGSPGWPWCCAGSVHRRPPAGADRRDFPVSLFGSLAIDQFCRIIKLKIENSRYPCHFD